MTDPTVSVRRFDSSSDLTHAAAKDLVDVISAAQRERGFASIVLTGGSNGNALAQALADADIDWSAVDLFFGDERFVSNRSKDRNELQLRDLLLDKVPLDPANVYRVPAADEFNGDADVAARVYAQRLDQNAQARGNGVAVGDSLVPRFDVHLLGMGGEGHINSLFPHTAAVAETSLPVVAVYESPKPPPTRITLTLPAVAAARRVWLLVSGDDKAEAVAAAVGGADPEDWPAAGARGSEQTVWYVDEAAASDLDAD